MNRSLIRCREKKRYRTKKAAKMAQKKLMQKYKTRLRIYKCRHGEHYHLTHPT